MSKSTKSSDKSYDKSYDKPSDKSFDFYIFQRLEFDNTTFDQVKIN